jgi:hypothetical protein
VATSQGGATHELRSVSRLREARKRLSSRVSHLLSLNSTHTACQTRGRRVTRHPPTGRRPGATAPLTTCKGERRSPAAARSNRRSPASSRKVPPAARHRPDARATGYVADSARQACDVGGDWASWPLRLVVDYRPVFRPLSYWRQRTGEELPIEEFILNLLTRAKLAPPGKMTTLIMSNLRTATKSLISAIRAGGSDNNTHT